MLCPVDGEHGSMTITHTFRLDSTHSPIFRRKRSVLIGVQRANISYNVVKSCNIWYVEECVMMSLFTDLENSLFNFAVPNVFLC